MMERSSEGNPWGTEPARPRTRQATGHAFLQLLVVVAAVIGVALRIRMYLENRSLWLDPAMLALNVINREAGELLGRLDMNQAAPAGFLLVSKAVGSLFGYSEYSLRLVPCVLGIAAVLLFFRLAVNVLGPQWAPLAYIPMATCSTAIFYCAEFRPQSADLFFSVLTLLAGHAVLERKWVPSAIAVFAFVGIVGTWFSYAVIFVVAGSGAALVLLSMNSSRRRAALRMSVAFTLVMLHFLVLYLLHIRPSIGGDLYTANTTAYAPVVAATWAQVWWWILAVTGYFEYPLGFRGLFIVPLVALVIGVGGWLVSTRRAPIAAVIGAPILPLLAASGLGLYPTATGVHEVRSRFVLFTVPIALLFIALGTSRLCELLGKKRWLSCLVVALLLIPSLYGGFAEPRFRGQEMRPLIGHLERHLQPGDSVYVFHASVPAFRYYTRHAPIEAVLGRSPAQEALYLTQDLQRLRHADRLWIVVSHAYGGERRVIRKALKAMGIRREVHRYPGAVLFECRPDR